ncbi:MAG: DUF1579 domain-containing protein [Sphingobacteriaceae bacterium]|nr:MAG: DUF1579 domain-containing protein [Sphingobacteriaceae bacterium]
MFTMKRLLLFILLTAPFTLLAQTTPGNTLTPAEIYIWPNTIHQKLAEYEGEWDEEVTMWLSPKSQPETYKIKCINKMILGGRYLQSSQRGYMMGTEFEGLTTIGYHTNNQKFTLTILNNIGTGTLTLLGFWITPFKSIELFGDIPNAENTDVIHVRQVINFIDKDNYVIQNFDKRAGHEEYKNMEYRFTRKKKN